MMKTYRIIVEQIVDELYDPDDREENPAGEYLFEALSEEEALDLFHDTVPIGCLEDFDICAELARE